MPPKQKPLQKRFLPSTINLDDSDEEERKKRTTSDSSDDSSTSDSDSSENDNLLIDDNDDEEIIDDSYKNEGADADIRPEDEEDILVRAFQDLKIEDKKQKEQKKQDEQVFIPGDDIPDDMVCQYSLLILLVILLLLVRNLIMNQKNLMLFIK